MLIVLIVSLENDMFSKKSFDNQATLCANLTTFDVPLK